MIMKTRDRHTAKNTTHLGVARPVGGAENFAPSRGPAGPAGWVAAIRTATVIPACLDHPPAMPAPSPIRISLTVWALRMRWGLARRNDGRRRMKFLRHRRKPWRRHRSAGQEPPKCRSTRPG